MKIYHNPRCSKSRQTLQLINDSGKKVEIIEYLKNPPTETELKKIIVLLGITPQQLIRISEPIYKENFKGKDFTYDEWIRILVANPVLIERPIVVHGTKAVLGRPPENVLGLL